MYPDANVSTCIPTFSLHSQINKHNLTMKLKFNSNQSSECHLIIFGVRRLEIVRGGLYRGTLNYEIFFRCKDTHIIFKEVQDKGAYWSCSVGLLCSRRLPHPRPTVELQWWLRILFFDKNNPRSHQNINITVQRQAHLL